jgi:hypothetical protein
MRAEACILLTNVFLFVVFLAHGSYDSYQGAGRIAAGVVLAALTCLPILDGILGRSRWWLWVCSILWFLPWNMLIPSAIGGS